MSGNCTIAPSVYLADGAIVRGDVTIGEDASVWFHAVVRGDEGPIRIGARSNVQDCAVVHSDLGTGVEIGEEVTIGHGAVVRGARIGDRAMIGMNATVMTGAVIGEEAIVGAGAVVPYGMNVPPRCLAVGVPARVVRELEQWELEQSRAAFLAYLELAAGYRQGKWKGP